MLQDDETQMLPIQKTGKELKEKSQNVDITQWWDLILAWLKLSRIVWLNLLSDIINTLSAPIYVNMCSCWRNGHLCFLVKQYIKCIMLEKIMYKNRWQSCAAIDWFREESMRPTFSYWFPPAVIELWKQSSFNWSPWERKKILYVHSFYSLHGSYIHVNEKDSPNQFSTTYNTQQNLLRGQCHPIFVCLLNSLQTWTRIMYYLNVYIDTYNL